jgi:hypothetical protein
VPTQVITKEDGKTGDYNQKQYGKDGSDLPTTQKHVSYTSARPYFNLGALSHSRTSPGKKGSGVISDQKKDPQPLFPEASNNPSAACIVSQSCCSDQRAIIRQSHSPQRRPSSAKVNSIRRPELNPVSIGTESVSIHGAAGDWQTKKGGRERPPAIVESAYFFTRSNRAPTAFQSTTFHQAST